MMCQRIGFPPISTSGLGRNSVSSRSRVPIPPHRITTLALVGREFMSVCLEAPVVLCLENGNAPTVRLRPGRRARLPSQLYKATGASGHLLYRRWSTSAMATLSGVTSPQGFVKIRWG